MLPCRRGSMAPNRVFQNTRFSDEMGLAREVDDQGTSLPGGAPLTERLKFDDPTLRGNGHCVGSVGDSELGKSTLEMRLHRVLRDT